jgi:glycosyltransferase involved in cell wall biosynthesis
MGMSTFVLTRRLNPLWPSAELVDNVPTYRVPPSGMKRFGKYAMAPAVIMELSRRRDDYDLIFVCGFRALGAPAVVTARRLGKTCVLRAETPGEMSGAYASAYRRLPSLMRPPFQGLVSARNRILRRADALVSISRPITEEFLRSGIRGDRIFEIPNGVDTEVWAPANESVRRSLRAKLGLPADGRIVVYSGKLNKGKGLEYLIEAWQRVSSSHADACLVLVGSGSGQSLSCEDEIRREVQERGLERSVKFTGFVQDPYDYVRASDIFVLPSENEALPMSMLEAMACALPVVVTDVGGIPEVVSHLNNGILVKPRDPKALAWEIDCLLSQPPLSDLLGANACRTVCERFSIQEVARQYLELFAQLHARKTA